jgi:iron complex transport system ATP-binding protein
MSNTVAIKLQNLSIGYRQAILNDINIELPSGNSIVLLGLNGTGKSTLLKTIAGIEGLLSGKIFLFEKDVFSLSYSERAKLASLIFSGFSESTSLKVYDYVSLGRIPYLNLLAKKTTHDEKLVNRAIELTGIEDFQNYYIDELSDGERQKCMIARALAQDTPIMLLDEPTSHLDVKNKAEITLLLKTIAEDFNKTIIYSSHDVDIAKKNSHIQLLIENNKLNVANLSS